MCHAQHKQRAWLASKSSSGTEPGTLHNCLIIQRAKWGNQLTEFCQLQSPHMPGCVNSESDTGMVALTVLLEVWEINKLPGFG